MEQGLLPSKQSDLQEERRLMYVGITRAKQKLIISYAKQRCVFGHNLYQKPSQFLSEIPARLIEHRRDKPVVTLKIPDGVDMPQYAYG